MQHSKYERWHDAIISRAKKRTLGIYRERHHIRPRSLGGSDAPENLVDLTYREHFLVHWLLTKICTGDDLRKMVLALHCMTMPLCEGRRVGSWRIEVSKRAIRKEWIRNRTERRRAEIDRHAQAVEAFEAMKKRTALIAAGWAASMKANPQVRDARGQFIKPRSRRKRPRAGRKGRMILRQQAAAVCP